MRDRWSRARRSGRTRAGGPAPFVLVLLGLVLWSGPALAFRVIGSPAGWARWDAAPRFVGGEERSLAGGLRYSIEHGDYGLLLSEVEWVPGTEPTEPEFAELIASAFEHWEVVDPSTALPAAFHFVEDLSTPAVDDAPTNPSNPNAFLGLNAGAEIDIFVATPHAGSGYGASVIFFVDTVEDDLTLTSGTTGYPGLAITGADIRMSDTIAFTPSAFETLLTHEIGHALGLADLEASPFSASVSGFIDDDYDPTTDTSVHATTSNSFALLIDPLDPDLSPLFAFNGNMKTSPGLDSPQVRLLMESDDWLSLRFVDPKLQNDEFAGRQFLYPVPEPGMGSMLVFGAATLGLLARTRSVEKAR
ncbi:MAG: hypothetical protein NXI30_19000 [bacterium]|nr:hypothetical protein [bacterium]